MTPSLTFLFPQALWALLILPLLWWAAPTRRWSHVAIRAAVFCCLILALAQPCAIHRAGVAPQVYVVDQRSDLSPGIRTAARRALDRRLAAAPRGYRLLVQLGGSPIVGAAIDARRMLPGGSLSMGLKEALSALPSGAGSVTLISDGRSTDTDWQAAVEALLSRRIPVDTIQLRDPVRRAFVSAVDASAVRVGERATVWVDVEGDGRPHLLTLSSEGGTIGAAPVKGSGAETLSFQVPATHAGFLPVRATLSGAGSGATMDGVVAVQDPTRVLYLGERQRGGGPRLQRLLGNGFQVEADDPRAIPTGYDFARFPLVFLDGVSPRTIPIASQRALAQAVGQHDTGLIAAGGEDLFGADGTAPSAIRSVLPVVPRPVERVEDPSIALAIVIDTSGSMDGALIEMAKQIARRTAAKLKPGDQLGIVEFYGNQQWALPMQPVSDPAGIDRTISRLKAQGSTILYPAIQEAYYGLRDVSARYRHILIISDGGVEESRYQQLLGQVAQSRISVSTVQVGTDTSGTESMANWARLGAGRFYSVPDEDALVEIDFRQPEVKPDPAYRPGRTALRDTAGPLWWRSAGIAAVPPLAGYVRVRARSEAETLLATSAGDPVLATWQYGGGRVTALMTEPLGGGSATWLGWRDYGRWLARLAAMTARQRAAAAVKLDRHSDHLSVTVQRLDGQPGPQPDVRFVTSTGERLAAPLALDARAPGLFVGDIPWSADRPALVEVASGDGGVVRAADRAGSAVSPLGAVPSARALPLDRLAALTGGRFAADPMAAVARPPARPGGLTSTDLWPWLTLAGMLLYLGDLLLRRTPRHTLSKTMVASR